MGALSRTKGHNFERWVALRLREIYPGTAIYRSQQADGPHQPDVVIPGSRLWIECQCSRKPTPKAKLEQAETDSAEVPAAGTNFWRPVAVWRQHGSRKASATMRYSTLSRFTGQVSTWQLFVTIDFEDFLNLLRGAQ